MKVTPTKARFMRHDPGQEFELHQGIARAFIRAGKLREVTTPVYETKVMEPEISERTGQPKRQYRRRDMTPEG